MRLGSVPDHAARDAASSDQRSTPADADRARSGGPRPDPPPATRRGPAAAFGPGRACGSMSSTMCCCARWPACWSGTGAYSLRTTATMADRRASACIVGQSVYRTSSWSAGSMRRRATVPDAVPRCDRSHRARRPIGHPGRRSASGGRPGTAQPRRRPVPEVTGNVRLGKTLDQSLTLAAQRLELQELKFFIISLTIQQETGGNLGEILYNLGMLMRRREQMKLKIKAMSSEARASAMIIGSLPFIMLLVIYVIDPELRHEVVHRPSRLDAARRRAYEPGHRHRHHVQDGPVRDMSELDVYLPAGLGSASLLAGLVGALTFASVLLTWRALLDARPPAARIRAVTQRRLELQAESAAAAVAGSARSGRPCRSPS